MYDFVNQVISTILDPLFISIALFACSWFVQKRHPIPHLPHSSGKHY